MLLTTLMCGFVIFYIIALDKRCYISNYQ